MKKRLKALTVEDSEDDALLLAREFEKSGLDVELTRVETKETLLFALEKKDWAIVLCDYSMPHLSGMTALQIIREQAPELPVIFVSGATGEDVAVEALLAGANDYIMKAHLQRLVPAVKRELRDAETRVERKQAEEEKQAIILQLEGANVLRQSLFKPDPLETKLTAITNGIVKYFKAEACCIWLRQPGDRPTRDCVHAKTADEPCGCRPQDKCLHLVAGSRSCTRPDLDDDRPHRAPADGSMIGRIASGDQHKFIVRDVKNAPQIEDLDWARQFGLESFAGYQLRVPRGKPIGVLAVFSRHTILPSEEAVLEGLSSAVALAIQQSAAEEALREARDELELRVEQRTAVLAQANEIMRREIAERQKAEEARRNAQAEYAAIEIQLRQSQKLEAIGQLASGIAHEINTPIQFIGDNARFLQQAFQIIQTVDSLYAELLQAAQKNSVTPELIARVEKAVAAGELEYLFKEIPEALSQTTEGVNRVTTIVRAMKYFSHPGNNDLARADLNKAIESTVTVARNEWKYVADMKLDLDPALPPVDCFVSEFNQAIVNLIVNAAHAIGDAVRKTPGTKGTITVSTRQEGESVEVRVSDTGSGIPEKIRPRIFEPFFTTKGVGKGTGQGLSVVYGAIVKRHGGTVEFESELGKGTTFVIRLPRCPVKADPKLETANFR